MATGDEPGEQYLLSLLGSFQAVQHSIRAASQAILSTSCT